MQYFNAIKSFLSEKNILYTIEKHSSYGPMVININDILKIFNILINDEFKYLRFVVYEPSGLELTDIIVNNVGLEDFSYLININNPAKLENIEITRLSPYYIDPFDFRSGKITSFSHSSKFYSITMNAIDFINGNFDRRYPALIICNSLNDINDILDIIRSHPVIIEIIGYDERLYNIVNQLFVNDDILAVIAFIDNEYRIKYGNERYIDKYSFPTHIKRIILENKICCTIKSANKRIN